MPPEKKDLIKGIIKNWSILIAIGSAIFWGGSFFSNSKATAKDVIEMKADIDANKKTADTKFEEINKTLVNIQILAAEINQSVKDITKSHELESRRMIYEIRASKK